MPSAPTGSILIPWSTESNLGFVLTRDADPEDTTIQGKFFDLVTNLPVTPDANTRLITLEKDTSRHEMFYFTGKTLQDADTQEYILTGCFRNLKWQGWDLVVRSTPITEVHAEDAEGSTVDVHYLMAIPWAILTGERATGGQYVWIGKGTAEHQYLGFYVDLGSGAEFIEAFRVNKDDGEMEWSDNNGASWNKLNTAGNHGTTANISAHTQMEAGVDTPAQYDLMAWVAGDHWDAVNYKTAMPTITSPIVYTPAFLTGGTGAESNAATWAALTNSGKFTITINGVLRANINPDFTGDASMADVAASIQVAIRAATGALETVTWSVDHFVISSADTTSSSAITVTSTPGSGTDISGAGASDWMDCDVGAGGGVVTDKALDKTFYEDYLVLLNSAGEIDSTWLEAALREAKTFFENTDMTGAEAETLTGGGDASTKHFHLQKVFQTTRAFNAASSTVNIAHGEGRAPKYVEIIARAAVPETGTGNNMGMGFSSDGFSDGTSHMCSYIEGGSVGSNPFPTIYGAGNSATKALHMNILTGSGSAQTQQQATVTLDATNIGLVFTKTGAGTVSNTIYITVIAHF